MASAVAAPSDPSIGMSALSPPKTMIGMPADFPSADDRSPHQTSNGSMMTTCTPALSISSAITDAR